MKRLLVIMMLLLFFTLFTSISWAALTQTQVSQLYIGVFGRASEGDGNRYWQTDPSSTSMTKTANIMLNTGPAKAYFGSTLNNNQEFIEHIYNNTLGKTYSEDPTGINYWVSELNSGKTKGEVIAALIVAAQHPVNAGAAQDQFNNKVEVSDYCADMIAEYTDSDTFTEFIINVTDDDTTVTLAIELIAIANNTFSTINMTITEDATDCGDGVYTYSPVWNFIQNGNNITVSGNDYDGDFFNLTGTLTGNTLYLSGSYSEGSGTTHVTAILTVSGNIFSGSASWMWEDSYSFCSGSDTILGVKQ